MDSRKLPGKQYISNVSFAPQPLTLIPATKHRLDSIHNLDNQALLPKTLRQDSVGLVSQNSLLGQRRDSLMGKNYLLGLNQAVVVKCLFQTRWKVLSFFQITSGLILMAVSLFSHYPIFTCEMKLALPDVDYLWFGLWIGFLNLSCGLCGLAASKFGLNDGGLHRTLRRSYFILNCSFLPFANGIGLTNFAIILSKFHLICNKLPDERFTTIMAFVQLSILVVCMILCLVGVVYQIVATIRCKCWICSPKNSCVIVQSS